MSNVEQLLAKAMSTTSEDEAIACLRMARKRNLGTAASTEYSADYWKQKAEQYYKIAKENQLAYRSIQSSVTYWQRRWNDTEFANTKLRRNRDALESKLLLYKLAVGALIPICAVMLAAVLT